MPFDWSRFASYSSLLQQDAASLLPTCCNSDESDETNGECAHLVRTAISRAYYAAFHRAYAFVQQKDPRYLEKTKEGGSHDEVWKWFWNSNIKSYRKVGEDGFSMKDDRKLADYTNDAKGLHGRLDIIIARSQRLIRRIDNL